MGGSKPQQPQFIQPPPPTITQAPPPNVQQNAADLFKAQLEFNPQLTAQAAQLQQQYGPQLAQSQVDIQRQQAPRLAQSQYELAQQYTPLYRSIYEQAFPEQARGLQTLASQSQQRFENPQGLAPQQQALQDAYRQRARGQIQQNVREASNLGGTLYGGRRQEAETEALSRFEQGMLESDLQRQMQNRSQALQEMIASQQVVFPQIQQPGAPQVGAPQFGQGVTPSPDALLQSILQGQIIQQPVYQPGNPGSPGFFGSVFRGLGGQPGGYY